MCKGITRTELLIVVGMIAALVVVLAPVFATAQATTGEQKCIVHGRELGSAMLAYMSDNDGRFPSEIDPAVAAQMMAKFANITWKYTWFGQNRTGSVGLNVLAYIQLAKYVKNKDTWICPAPTTMLSIVYALGYRQSWLFHSSNLGSKSYPDAPFQLNGMGLTLSETLAKDKRDWNRYMTPSRKFFAWCYSLGEDYAIESYKGGPLITPSYAHGEGSIYLFADGHAKWCEMGCGFAPVHYTDNNIDRPHKILTSAAKS
jgi:prepilin-type processing-associated H-X9-DG protein